MKMLQWLSWTLVLLAFPISGFAAGPITHILLAEKGLEDWAPSWSKKERALFFMGNLFPDIRYVGELSREDTHETGLALEQVFSSPSAFLAGMRLHAYIDERREARVIDWNIYPHISAYAQGHPATLLKLVEDERFYDRIDVPAVIENLADILEDEIAMQVSYPTLKKWHRFLSHYFSRRPSCLLNELAKAGQPFLNIPASTVELWGRMLPELAQQKELIDYISRLEAAFLEDFQLMPPPLSSSGPFIRMEQSVETDDCVINWIQNAKGETKLVKQIKEPSADEQFLLVLDAFACFLACQAHIPMNQVTLIPAHQFFSAKFFADRLATLHSLVPGAAVSNHLPWPAFTMHQRYRRPGSSQWKKWGPLPEPKAGLTPEIIFHMSQHPILPKIAAFDTFVGNADRSDPNLFYDPLSHSFYGIDLAAAFNTVLAKPACDQLSQLFQQGKLSEQEREGLSIYYQTLHHLTALFPLETLLQLFEGYALQAGFQVGQPFWSRDVEDRMAHHRKVMRENFKCSLELLEILEDGLQISSTPVKKL